MAVAIDTNPLVVLRATKMLLAPIESRDLIGAYKRDNLEEAIVHLLMIIDPAKDRYLTTSCVDMWYEVLIVQCT